MKSYKKQIIIGIDGNEANIEERVGVHQYAYEILWAIHNLRKNQPINYRFIIYLKERPKISLTWSDLFLVLFIFVVEAFSQGY